MLLFDVVPKGEFVEKMEVFVEVAEKTVDVGFAKTDGLTLDTEAKNLDSVLLCTAFALVVPSALSADIKSGFDFVLFSDISAFVVLEKSNV
jgi:hypothetical protein